MIKRLSMTASLAALALALGAGAAGAAPLTKAEASSKLVAAIRDNDHEAIKALLARGADANQVQPDTTTPIYLAIDHQDAESVKLLLAAGAKASVKDQDGATPLLLACLLGNADIVNSLLDAHADPKPLAQGGVSAFTLCSGSPSAAVVERMIAAGEAVDQTTAAGQTPLMYAAAHGQTDNIKVLLGHGAKVNAASASGFTPVMFAMRGGSLDAVRTLIAAGADVSHVTPDGATALQIALEDKNVPFATLLVNSGAALKGNWDLHGRTPLQMAVLARNSGLVKLMLSKGADPNEQSRLAYGINPNDISFHPPPGDRRFDAPRKPIDYKALGYTPRLMLHTNLDGGGPAAMPAAPTVALLLAASTGQTDVMKTLVDGGADAKFVNGDGVNVLLASALSRKLDAVQYAASVSPDINAKRKDGSNVLHLALGGGGPGGGGGGGGGLAEDETFQVVKFFVDQGVSIDAKNNRGQTAIGMALDRGDPRTQAMFKQIVADKGIAIPPPVGRRAAPAAVVTDAKPAATAAKPATPAL